MTCDPSARDDWSAAYNCSQLEQPARSLMSEVADDITADSVVCRKRLPRGRCMGDNPRLMGSRREQTTPPENWKEQAPQVCPLAQNSFDWKYWVSSGFRHSYEDEILDQSRTLAREQRHRSEEGVLRWLQHCMEKEGLLVLGVHGRERITRRQLPPN
ncbi:hypothetical protein C0Q70_02817 [Pomacea canaliculata]|uniref:Uncharacterized protein n=1 Tax=Pomacea canaliculata TaxID=400727 RepID=A0A2T7PR07_POMCA|nr:hypothetical protein C0Q70_02817 [Pomacea canaliculata]